MILFRNKYTHTTEIDSEVALWHLASISENTFLLVFNLKKKRKKEKENMFHNIEIKSHCQEMD